MIIPFRLQIRERIPCGSAIAVLIIKQEGMLHSSCAPAIAQENQGPD